MNLLIGFFTVLLILVSLFMVMIILMQRPRGDSGLGAALGGGGAADAAFGAETSNILSRGTIYSAIFFFVASFGLYIGHMYMSHRAPENLRALPPELRSVEEPAGQADIAPEEEPAPVGTGEEPAGQLDVAPVEEPAPVEQEPLP